MPKKQKVRFHKGDKRPGKLEKQLKNRYNDPSINRAFIIGVDRAKMRLYDVQQASQNIVDANQTDEKEDAYNKFSDFKL